MRLRLPLSFLPVALVLLAAADPSAAPLAIRVIVQKDGAPVTRTLHLCVDRTRVRVERGVASTTAFPGAKLRVTDPQLGVAEREVRSAGDVVLELKPEGVVRGRVIDADGLVVEGARVRVSGESDEPCDPAEDGVETDAAGRFSVMNVSGSSAGVSFVALPDGLLASDAPRPNGKLGGPGKIVGVPVENVVLRVHPARDVSGTVLGADGRRLPASWKGRVRARAYSVPAERASVDVSYEDEDTADFEALAGGGGAFTFRDLPARWIYSMWACGSSGFSEPVDTRPGMPPVSLRLARSGTVAGRVTRRGEPVNARVDVEYIVNGNWEHCDGEPVDPVTGRFDVQLAHGRGRLHIVVDDADTRDRCETVLERDLTVAPGTRLDIGDVDVRCRADDDPVIDLEDVDAPARERAPPVVVPQGATKIGRFVVSFDDPASKESEASHKRAIELLGRTDLALSPLFGRGAPRTIRVRFSRDTKGTWPPGDPRWEDPFLDVTGRFDDRVGAKVNFDLGVEMQFRAPQSYGDRGPGFQWLMMHEAVHAFLGESFAQNAPLWLSEGAAEYFSRAPGHGPAPKRYATDERLDEDLRKVEPGAYEAARRKVEKLVEECGEEGVVGWLLDLRTDARAALGRRVPCNPKSIAVWEWTPPIPQIRHASMDELTTVLAIYQKERSRNYENPAGVELLPLDASVGLASSSAAFVLERTIRATRLPRQDALDTLVAGLLPNGGGHRDSNETRRYHLLESAFARTQSRFVADLLGHALSYGEALPDDETSRTIALLELPRGVRAYWMGEALLRHGEHGPAEKHFEVALREGVANADRAHFAYAVTACRNGHYETCLREMNLVQMEPRYIAKPEGQTHYEHEATREWWRAKAFAKLGRRAEAIASFKESIVRFDLLDPYEPDPWGPIDADLRVVICETGIAFANENKWKEAGVLFDRADCTEERGRAFVAQERWVDAFLAFEGAWRETEVAESIAALAKFGFPRAALRDAITLEKKCLREKRLCEQIAGERDRIEGALPAHRKEGAARFLRGRSASDQRKDGDGDGLSTWDEAWIGSDPASADTDGDGTTDDRDPQPLAPREAEPTVEDEVVYRALGTRLFATKPPPYGKTPPPALGPLPRFVLSNRPLFRAWQLPSRMVVLDDDEADAVLSREAPVALERILVASDPASARWLVMFDVNRRRGTVLVWRDANGDWMAYVMRDAPY